MATPIRLRPLMRTHISRAEAERPWLTACRSPAGLVAVEPEPAQRADRAMTREGLRELRNLSGTIGMIVLP